MARGLEGKSSEKWLGVLDVFNLEEMVGNIITFFELRAVMEKRGTII